MSRLPNGLRKMTHGWKDPLWRPPVKREQPPVTDEHRAKIQKLNDDFIEKAGWNKPRDPLEKIEDRKARDAVEGDTDLNHDNVEEPVDSLAARVRSGETVL